LWHGTRPLILSPFHVALQAHMTLKLTKLSDLIAKEEDSTKRAELLQVFEDMAELREGKLEAEKGKLEAEVQVVLMREMTARTAMLAAKGALHVRGYLGEHHRTREKISTLGSVCECFEGPRRVR
jgi:hypothetical protein